MEAMRGKVCLFVEVKVEGREEKTFARLTGGATDQEQVNLRGSTS